MYYTQQRTLKLSHKVERYKPQSIDNHDYKFTIPRQHIEDYKEAISTLTFHNQPIVNAFHSEYGEPPFTHIDFLEFLKVRFGLECTVYAFSQNNFEELDIGLTSETKGTWCWNNEEKSEFSVWVNTEYPTSTQNVTIIHEAIHAIQDFDYNFHEILRRYPIPIQVRIAERIAEKTAIAVVLPNIMLENDKRKGLRSHQVALKYNVSLQMAGYAI